MTHLPGYAHDLLTSCPKAGTGVHNWLFRTARVLHRFMPQERIALELRDKVQTCGRIVTETDDLRLEELHQQQRQSRCSLGSRWSG